MLKRFFILLLVILSAKQMQAQQSPQYSQWFWNLMAINPAFSGLKPCLEIKTLYRNQWANLPGSPNSGFMTFSLPIYTKQKEMLSPRQGCGFKFETDKIGAFSMNRFMVNYAAHFNFTPDTRLSVGISAGVKQWVFDRTKVTTLDVDPVIQESASFISPDAALGAWWNGKNYFATLSLSELIPSKWNNISTNSKFHMHTYLGGGFRIIGNEKITILPYILLRIPSKGPVSMDLNLMFSYMNKFDFGLGFRNTDAINALFQYRFNSRFAIGYSMDYILSNVSNKTLFSHEFSLAFGSCRTQNTNKTVCPLF